MNHQHWRKSTQPPYVGQDWGSGTSLLQSRNLEVALSSWQDAIGSGRAQPSAINSSKHICPPRRHIAFTRAGEQLQPQSRMSTGLKWAGSYTCMPIEVACRGLAGCSLCRSSTTIRTTLGKEPLNDYGSDGVICGMVLGSDLPWLGPWVRVSDADKTLMDPGYIIDNNNNNNNNNNTFYL